MTSDRPGEAERAFLAARRAHWDGVAAAIDCYDRGSVGYHARVAEVYRSLVPAGQRVLEVGCGAGELLAAVRPAYGVGVDLSPATLAIARARHPQLRFILSAAEALTLDERFDYIICSDIVNELWDVQRVFEALAAMSTPRTRLVLNFYSRLWELPLRVAKRFGASRPLLEQNWLTVEDVANLLALSGHEIVRRSEEVLWPARTPLISRLCNRRLVRLWPFGAMALSHFVVARPVRDIPRSPKPSVSVVVPARNEAGNIGAIFDRLPHLGGDTELIFVEGGSTDGTREVIEQQIRAHPAVRARLYLQTGQGKGDAVRLGFARATGDILMILDADMTVAPEDLERFYAAIRSGVGEFVNGVRLVYPMQNRAMRFFNLLGNKFFSLLFSWLLGQPIKDTLCGTKVLWRSDYELISASRNSFGTFDPFGDFDLLFGAAGLSLKIVEMPIRYRERTYGETNIRRWSDGWLLLKMAGVAARRLKWI